VADRVQHCDSRGVGTVRSAEGVDLKTKAGSAATIQIVGAARSAIISLSHDPGCIRFVTFATSACERRRIATKPAGTSSRGTGSNSGSLTSRAAMPATIVSQPWRYVTINTLTCSCHEEQATEQYSSFLVNN
jgi:hypothetical protein